MGIITLMSPLIVVCGKGRGSFGGGLRLGLSRSHECRSVLHALFMEGLVEAAFALLGLLVNCKLSITLSKTRVGSQTNAEKYIFY